MGGGVYAFGSTIILNQPSSLFLTNNSAEKGGGVYFEVNTRIVLKKYYPEKFFPKVILLFSGNHAMLGGAIYVDDNTYYGACTTTTECFIQVQALYKNDNFDTEDTQPIKVNNINIYFSENKTKGSGDNIYGGLLNACIAGLLSEVEQCLIGNESIISLNS